MDAELKNLQIDRARAALREPSKWATRWIIAGVLLFLLLGAGGCIAEKFDAAPEVEVQRVKSISAASAPAGRGPQRHRLHRGRAQDPGGRQGGRQGGVDRRR